jgi:hypothetical protein
MLNFFSVKGHKPQAVEPQNSQRAYELTWFLSKKSTGPSSGINQVCTEQAPMNQKRPRKNRQNSGS